MLVGAARLHRVRFERFVDEAGETVEVRQPAAPTAPASALEKVQGKRPSVAAYGDTQTVQAIQGGGYDGNVLHPPSVPAQIAAIGKVQPIDLLLRCKLADALIDSGKRYGQTIFDTAKDVVFAGAVWTVLVTERSGLPPEGPYELWVGLRKSGGA